MAEKSATISEHRLHETDTGSPEVQVAMLTQRANERLLLTRREHSQLRANLWNNLAAAVNEAVEPLSAERR